MLGQLDDLGQAVVGREAGEDQAAAGELAADSPFTAALSACQD